MFLKAAKQGYVNAQNDIGRAYKHGKGVSIDKVVAFNWYKKASEAGNAETKWHLCLAYSKGDGVSVDKIASSKWERRAAPGGYPQKYYQGK